MANISIDALTAGTVTSTTLIPAVVTTAATVAIQPKDFAQVMSLSSVTAGTLTSTSLLLGTVTSSGPVTFQAGTFPTGTYRVTGLIGNNSSSTPATQYVVSAAAVELWKPSDNSMRYVTNTSAIINNLNTTGNNGRDQVAAFASNVWIHLYFVGGDTVTSSTLATRSSLTAPPTGPSLPSSETRWAYAGTVRNDAGAALLPTKFMNGMAQLLIPDGGVNRVLSGGTSTSFATIDCSSVIPPVSSRGLFYFTVFGICTAGAGSFFNTEIRPLGSTFTGQFPVGVIQQVAGVNNASNVSMFYPVSSSQAIEYQVVANSTGPILIVDVHGYNMPNGAGA